MRSDWVETELGQICDIISGKNQSTVVDPKGEYPIYGSGGIIGYADDYLCERGCTIIGRKGTINSPIYVSTRFWNVDTAFGFSPVKQFSNKLLYYFCIFFNFKKLDKSTTIPSLAKRDLLKINLLIPPLPEQRAIVAKIEQLFSDLDNGIANLKTAQDQLKVYRQAVLKKAFEGELTKEWRDKQLDLPSADKLLEQIKEERTAHYQKQLDDWELAVKDWEENGKEGKKPGKPKKLKELQLLCDELLGEGSESSNGWSQMTLESCCKIIVDCPHSTPKWTKDAGKICLRTTNFLPNNLDLSTVRYVSEETFNKRIERLKPELNDILYSREGGILGIACILNQDIDVCLGQRMMLLRASHFVLYSFITYFLNSPNILIHVESLITGCAAPHINVGDVKKYSIPICSLEEQTQIVQEIESRLSVCDKVEETIKESLKKAEALRQSILKKAFEGRLLSEAELDACRKEADWEPAEVLLERIKREKSK